MQSQLTFPTKLFVVDDECSLADLLSLILRNAGFEVETFYDGQQAFDRLASGNVPHLVVTDIMMPVLNGITLTKQVLKQWPSCKILFLSSDVQCDFMHEFALHVAQIGALRKPAPILEILKEIERLLYAQTSFTAMRPDCRVGSAVSIN
jgi:CheY-like chemotaxis protein